MAPPMADHDRNKDIVQLALAILDEELDLWVKSGRRGPASQAGSVSEPDGRRRDTS